MCAPITSAFIMTVHKVAIQTTYLVLGVAVFALPPLVKNHVRLSQHLAYLQGRLRESVEPQS